MPGPVFMPLPPVFVPGTAENGLFAKGTIDALKGIGRFFDDMFDSGGGPDDDPNTEQADHTTNRTPSNRPKHEKGDARRQRDQGDEKKDKNGRFKKNPNKRQQGAFGQVSDADNSTSDATSDDEGD